MIVMRMRFLFVAIVLLSNSACMAPPLQVEAHPGSVVVNLTSLGEYPSAIARIELTDVETGAAIWEVERVAKVANLWKFSLVAGTNSLAPEGLPKDAYRVVKPINTEVFLLSKDRAYRVAVEGTNGRTAQASFSIRD
jgi:hypothetical protein